MGGPELDPIAALSLDPRGKSIPVIIDGNPIGHIAVIDLLP
jgi:hypothetical protein